MVLLLFAVLFAGKCAVDCNGNMGGDTSRNRCTQQRENRNVVLQMHKTDNEMVSYKRDGVCLSFVCNSITCLYHLVQLII